MSNLVIDIAERGDPRRIATANDFHDAFEALTIDRRNLREEGIGRRTLGAYVRTDSLAVIEEDTRAASPAVTGAGFAQFVMGATTFRWTPGAPLVLAADEQIQLRARVTLESSVAADVGLSAGDTFGIRFAWRNNTSGVTITPGTMERNITAAGVSLHGSIASLGRITGPITLTWIELQYRLSAGTARPGCGQFFITRRRRTS